MDLTGFSALRSSFSRSWRCTSSVAYP